VKIAIISVAAVGVASAITFPILANTVWKGDSAIEIKFTTEEEGGNLVFVSKNFNLIKDKEYKFSLNLNELNIKYGHALAFGINNGSEEVLTKYVSSGSFKTNKNNFTKADDAEWGQTDLKKYQYFYATNYKYYFFGKESFSSDENVFSGSFKATDNGNDLTIFVGFSGK